jgi:hypothetical protein
VVHQNGFFIRTGNRHIKEEMNYLCLPVDEKTGPGPAGYQEKFIRSWLVKGAYESTGFIPKTGVSGRWLLAAAPIRNVKGAESGAA